MHSQSNNNQEELWKVRSEKYDGLNWASRNGLLSTFFSAMELEPHHKVLDVGAGTGKVTIPLSEKTLHVTGLDISQEMLSIAKSKSKGIPNIDFVKANVCDIPFQDETFDIVSARMVFHHVLDNPEIGISECRRVLKKGGKLVLCEGIPPNPGVKEDYMNIFKLKEERHTFLPEDLENLLKQGGFEKIRAIPHIEAQVSVANWLSKSGLPQEVQNKIMDLHLNSSDFFKKSYNMTMRDNDCMIDMKFLIFVGEK